MKKTTYSILQKQRFGLLASALFLTFSFFIQNPAFSQFACAVGFNSPIATADETCTNGGTITVNAGCSGFCCGGGIQYSIDGTTFQSSNVFTNVPAGNYTVTVRAVNSPSIKATTSATVAYNCSDQCPNDPDKTEPGVCGCGVPDIDSDNDGLADCIDACPNDPDNDIDGDGICGDVDICPADYDPAQGDGDGDGHGDACDNCAAFPNSDQADTDGDGKGDKCDLCGNDPVEADNNGNGLPDCQECGNGNGTAKVKVTFIPANKDVCDPANEKEKCISVNALAAWLAGGNGNEIRYEGAPRLAYCPSRKAMTRINETHINLFPNPAQNRLTVSFDASVNENINMYIYDMTGKMAQIQEVEIISGEQNVKVNISNLADGIYFLKFQIGEKLYSEKFVKTSR